MPRALPTILESEAAVGQFGGNAKVSLLVESLSLCVGIKLCVVFVLLESWIVLVDDGNISVLDIWEACGCSTGNFLSICSLMTLTLVGDGMLQSKQINSQT